MAQRVGLAQALMGDPRVLILDEPANGLDPHSISWLRALLRALADEGRAVLVSSHLLGEMEQLADRLVILARGRVVARTSIAEIADAAEGRVVVETPAGHRLRTGVQSEGGSVRELPGGRLEIRQLSRLRVGDLAAELSVPLYWLSEETPSLEEFYLSVAEQEYRVG
jgi:ABC-2 type transport system ATP-binding protein